MALWVRAGKANPQFRVTAARYSIGQILLQGWWAVLVFGLEPGGPLFYGLFAAGAAGEMFVPWYAERAATTHWHRHLAFAGIALAVVSIQFVMRQIFLFDELLLRPALPPPRWLARVLLDDAAGLRQTFYFAALLLVVAATAWLLAAARRGGAPAGPCALLGVLVLVQAMLLPITYGVLTAGREVPRIAWPEAAGSPPGEAWLVWETKEDLVLLARRGGERRIVRIEKKQVARLETLCNDPLLLILHAGESSHCGGG